MIQLKSNLNFGWQLQNIEKTIRSSEKKNGRESSKIQNFRQIEWKARCSIKFETFCDVMVRLKHPANEKAWRAYNLSIAS